MPINGAIPTSQMVQRQGMWLWPSTAAKFDAMNADLTARGYPAMIITPPYGGYRSLADQVQVKKLYGAGAATVGYSNHGLARAWDIDNISHYPAGVIPAAAARHRLLIDAGNGHGQIESWHMHDADGIAPAGTSTPVVIPVIESKDKSMQIVNLTDGKGNILPGKYFVGPGGMKPILSGNDLPILSRLIQHDGNINYTFDPFLQSEVNTLIGYCA